MHKDGNPLNEIYSLLESGSTKSVSELVKDKQEKLNLTNSQLHKLLGISRSTYDRLMTGEVKKADVISFLKLSQFLGLDLDSLIKMYVSHTHSDTIAEIESARKGTFIVENFDLDRLHKVGFINDKSDFEAIEDRIKSFFGISTIFEFNDRSVHPLYSQTKVHSNDKMRDFWLKSAYYQFEKIDNPNPFDPDQLRQLIPKIRPYTRMVKNGLLSVVKALYNVGVTVIVQGYLSTTQVRGATMVVNGKPCIVLTDYKRWYSTLWFALLHELYHVLYDFEDLKKVRYHLTGEEDLFLLDEESADFFAHEMLFPSEKLDYISEFIRNKHLVLEYAYENKVHPSIIYSFYMWRESQRGNATAYSFFSKYMESSNEAIRTIKLDPWDKENLEEGALRIKEKLEKLTSL